MPTSWGEKEKIITIQHIQRKVAEFFGVKLSDMRAKNRTKAVAFPRTVAMHLARQLSCRSPRWARIYQGVMLTLTHLQLATTH